MPVTPLINGISHSWANVKLNLFGVPVVGITEINYARKQKKENNYGSGVDPVSRGYGNVENEGSITIYREEWLRIIQASPNRDPLQIPPFDIQVLFGGSSVSFAQDTLRAVEFTNDPFEGKQGDSALMVKLDLVIGLIEHTI
jgi:hypothetical protein